MVAVPAVFSQTAKDLAKERKEMSRMAEAELNARAVKDARKAARQAAKDGWKVAPGALPLEKQFDRTYKMQYQFDENGFPMFIMGEATSPGQTYDAAKMQANVLAKQILAGQLQTEMTAIIESTVGNQQLGADEAASVTETVMASKDMISQRLGRVIPVVECYRDTRDGKEVRVMIAYNSRMAMEAAKETVKEQLEKKGVELHEQLDELLGF